MNLNDLFLEQLEREVAPSRRVLEQVPEGKNDWKPHAKSMPLGYLAALVASMPGWVSMIVDTEDFDLRPPGGASGSFLQPQPSTQALLQLLEESAAKARKSLTGCSDEHLQKVWRLLVGGHPVSEQVRYVAIGDAFCHAAHHRGQLTVYLRLNDAKVPSVYGPSADDASF